MELQKYDDFVRCQQVAQKFFDTSAKRSRNVPVAASFW
ncbi:hypothetical protein FAES_1087 [Fibrella aestuarina BUZ 2]|uniref:Uncharacterized protein n=1 Tax=Fibrella aestuarina BUZ 2 TaxID=1166018 RepID=I0K4P4_9BACT|nr:hypothetical protein FAES_1087 [Fibrella aestuarina BUZ 2]